jgi:hypothetical protein
MKIGAGVREILMGFLRKLRVYNGGITDSVDV